MKKQELMRTFNKVAFQLKKHSPEIMVVAGTIGVVTSTVLACKATTKISQILDESKESIDSIHHGVEHPEELATEYTIEDSKRDLTVVYFQTGLKLAKLYAPAVILGVASLTCILKSHDILKKRNIAIAAAYATEQKCFKDYRARLIERFDEKLDKELRYDIKVQEIEEVVTDSKGKEKIVKKKVEVASVDNCSDYARYYDSNCRGWENNPEYNLMFLRAQERLANDMLIRDGYLFLNDVYDLLGIKRSKAGQVVGWVYDPTNPDIDNHVDFGIYDIHKAQNRDFVNGCEPTILLDFNVDGDIWSNM